ncbi:hypothetical protein KM043_010425 [Ampulex compressa]|nr:hypothetical protein KM043_010425 [Ampulex compressa]
MDTKTPPIPLKVQEKPQPKKQERVADVSLPPLTSHKNHRQKRKPPGTPWSRDAPCTIRYQDHHKKRPYRVLPIGATPLMHACQQADRTRVLRLLKEQEATIGYRDRTLRSALHYCMDAGTGGAVASAAPELVNAQDAEGHTPLHLAVIAGDTQLVAVLLANGADVNAKDLEGHSVLHWATVCGEAECVRLVLAAGARPSTPDLRGGSPLHYAAQCCGAAATAELAVPKKVGLKVLQTLLEFGADVNAKDEDGRQPILWAASAGSVEAVLALARAGGSAAAGASDKDGLTALHCAASRGHARCVEALVNLCGSQPDHVDDNGCSALHYAATLGHADATALILKLRADPNRQDRKGRTPALCAAAKGQLETLKILAQHGGSLHARTVRGTGVAHEAVASGRIELIKWLAKKRPSTLDVATHDGKTPLHVAALHGHLDACKVLLDNGARINAVLRTNKGNLMTALDAALYRGYRDCAKLIQLHGGTTAQQLRAQKISPNKVFAAKLRVGRFESSTDTESSPRRRGRRRRHPELYYEEKWIERRTRRRGSLRKLSRRDSRSFSEEEVRLSKTKKDRRRARSESARYDDDEEDSTDRKLRRKISRKRSSRYSYDTESSLDSDSCDRSRNRGNGGVRKNSRKRSDKSRSRESKERSNGTERDEARDPDEEEKSVSDDSLEVVIVKKSLEKKCEKVISGKRSKTPRESSRETKLTKSRTSSRMKSRSSRSRISENGEASTDRGQSSEQKDSRDVEAGEHKTPRTSMDEGKMQDETIVRRYRKDVTDSTSQETVERVVVTAMVHKDQAPDTPKLDASKEVTFEDGLRTVESEELRESSREPSCEGKFNDIVEKSEESRSSLVTKAADMKKDVEEIRQQAAQEVSRESVDVKQGEGKVIEEGRIDAENGSKSVSSDSRKESPPSEDQRPDKSTSKSKRSSLSSNADTTDAEKTPQKATRESKETSALPEESEETARSRGSKDEKDEIQESSTPRTAVQDVPGSLEESPRTRSRDDTARSKSSSDDRGSKSSSSRRSDSQESIGSTKQLESHRGKKESSGRNGAPAKRVSIEETSKTEESAITKEESLETRGKDASLESVEKEASLLSTEQLGKDSDKEQADSARGKSVEFSSESRDSILAEEGDEGSLRIDSPISARRRASEDEGGLVDERFDLEGEEKKADEGGRGRRRSIDISGVLAKGDEKFRYIDESSSSSPRSTRRRSRPSTSKAKRRSSSKSPAKRSLFESSEERSPDRSAIIAVIESPEWDEEDEEVEKEIRDAIGDDVENDTEPEDDNELGVVRVLPSTSEEETPRIGLSAPRTSEKESLPQVQQAARVRQTRIQTPEESRHGRLRVKQRRDSGGRDSGIEPSPRVSRIPRRRSTKCCPNTQKQQMLNMETITRDVQISLRRYHLERKIFFQLMELKRLQIRHGRTNEQVLVKRQVESFHKAGMAGPTLGIAKYDQPLTFRHFEAFLYEQLRKLQRRPATPDFCTEAKQCTQKTHRCHHATSAYTSVPVYTYHYNCSGWRRPRKDRSSSEDREPRKGANDRGGNARGGKTSDSSSS